MLISMQEDGWLGQGIPTSAPENVHCAPAEPGDEAFPDVLRQLNEQQWDIAKQQQALNQQHNGFFNT
jgi:hypothetical protein